MADTPSDDTPSSAPPRRRRTRTSKVAGTPSGARAKPAATKPATRRASATAAAKPRATKKSATAAAPKATRKPRATASTSKAAAPKRGIGRVLALTAATVLSVAAGAAAIFGRRKIAKVSTDTLDSVMGKSDTASTTTHSE